ncbi:MAG: aspartate aminotransferase family protein [Actinomycetota bacterium]
MSVDRRVLAPATASALFMERARASIAGGDSSTMRVLPYHVPLVAERGEGARVWDLEGREYLDLNMAYGPLILGHRPRRVVDAVTRQIADHGSQLGFPTAVTVRVAEKLKLLFPSIELLRFANSGTEAVASATRLARAYTGRRKLVMFEGHYHGWSDAVFNRYHAQLSELPEGDHGPALAGTSGMGGSLEDVIVVRWNDLDALHRVLDAHRGEVAGVLMEAIMGNAGVIPPHPGFLLGAREAAHEHGAVLIFDEVITGMRVAAGGAQEHYDVRPDITVVSKALGGGYPVAAFGASEEIMRPIVDGTLFHGGVFSGNAVVMAAAEAVLDEILENREIMYTALHETANALVAGMREIMTELDVPHIAHNVGPMISLFLTDVWIDGIDEYRTLRRHGNFDRYVQLQHHLQSSGVYLHPNMFEPMYLSTAHSFADVDSALERMHDSARATLVR